MRTFTTNPWLRLMCGISMIEVLGDQLRKMQLLWHEVETIAREWGGRDEHQRDRRSSSNA